MCPIPVDFSTYSVCINSQFWMDHMALHLCQHPAWISCMASPRPVMRQSLFFFVLRVLSNLVSPNEIRYYLIVPNKIRYSLRSKLLVVLTFWVHLFCYESRYNMSRCIAKWMNQKSQSNFEIEEILACLTGLQGLSIYF